MPQIDLARMVVMVEASADLTSTARVLSERNRDYYDGYQWTAEEEAILRRRKQPVIVDERIKRKVDAMVGIEQQGRVDPRAYARNPQDEQAADVATKALVYVDDNTRFDAKRSAAFENLLVEGYGGCEVVVEAKRGQMEIVINQLRWEELFYDPHSRSKDFSDATYMGCQKWMTVDSALERYAADYEGGAEALEEVLRASFGNQQDGETYEDRPNRTGFVWGDDKLKRVRVVQMYYRSAGVWYLAVFTSAGEIIHMVSPYLDEDGEPTNPIVLMSAYVDRENRRYGLVSQLISPQDEINKRRSKLLHELNSRQTIGAKGAVNDIAAMKRELASPDGHVEINLDVFEASREVGHPPFQIVQRGDQIAGQFSLLQEAKQSMDTLGPDASLLGQMRGDQSGRAIMAQQQAGMASVAPVYESLRDWTLRMYRAIWQRIRQYWTEERWVRVTDDTRAATYIGVNQTVGYDPMTMQPIRQNELGQMDMDIIIDEVPDYVSLKHEQFEQLVRMSDGGVSIPPEVLIMASNLHDKDALLEKMQEAGAAQSQQQQAMMQMQQQMQQMDQQIKAMLAQAKVERDSAAAAKDAASIDQIRTQAAANQADTQKTLVETQRLALGF